jgi:hypothetical protein
LNRESRIAHLMRIGLDNKKRRAIYLTALQS